MNKITDFIDFIKSNFDSHLLSIDKFKENVIFIEINCLTKEPGKEFALVITDEYVGFSTLEKPSVTGANYFSMYDEYVNDFEKAKAYTLQIKDQKYYSKAHS
jgi:hypothetical protein